MWMFLRSLPEHFDHLKAGKPTPPASAGSFFALFRIPTLRIITIFVSIATFGLYLVYTWLPTFLYDKFSLGLARAGFEASVYPQVGTALGLLAGGLIGDRWYRRARAGRLWVVSLGFLLGGPCIFWLGAAPTLMLTRTAAIGFGFFVGFITGNQAACAFDVVPASLRASTVGVLNLVGVTTAGFAPFLGGLSRKTIGVDRLMSFSALLFLASGILVIYGTRRHFDTDHRLGSE
jgi:MFS family permease